MKKKIYLKTAIFSLLAMSLLSSCLKDSRYVNYGGVGTLVEFPLAEPNGFSPGAFSGEIQTETFPITQTTATITVAVNVASPRVPTTATSVKVSIDTVSLDAYNNAQGSNFLVLPAGSYTSTLATTVPANQRLGYFTVTIDLTKLDPTQSYALPITITSASQPIASTLKTLIYTIGIKNIYDGTYSLKGFVFRDTPAGNDPTLGGYFTGQTQGLATVGINSVTLAPVWATGADAGGVGGTTLTVNPTTNAVSIASGNATLVAAPGYNNRYDPTTKTFYVSYKWGVAPNDRAETDTLTYTGSR